MARIKSIADISDKWNRVTPTRSMDYKDGVQNPKKDWAEETIAAEDTYKRGVIEAANQGRFGKGVANAGTKKWKDKALSLGPSRFAEGVAVAKKDYEAGFAPYRDVIESTELPPRGPKGDPTNLQRVAVIATALHGAKLGK